MRLGPCLLIGSSLVAIMTVVACQQRTSVTEEGDDDDSAEETTSKPKTQTKGDDDDAEPLGCLAEKGLSFDNAECQKCMSDTQACCDATFKCFKEDAECGKLQACMETCKGGNADAGALVDCQTKCKTDNAAGLTNWQAYNTCTQTTCSAQCGGGGGDGGTTPVLTPAQAFAALYPKAKQECGSCHTAPGVNGAKIFIGPNEAETLTLFKAAGYDKANSLFVTKGQHLGPPLSAGAKSAVDAWVAASAGGGAGTGGGGGNGTGGGNGQGGGGGN